MLVQSIQKDQGKRIINIMKCDEKKKKLSDTEKGVKSGWTIFLASQIEGKEI